MTIGDTEEDAILFSLYFMLYRDASELRSLDGTDRLRPRDDLHSLLLGEQLLR